MRLEIFVCETSQGLWHWYVYNEHNTVLDEGVCKTQSWALRKAKASRAVLTYDITGEWVTNET